jgi:hypothetical protein
MKTKPILSTNRAITMSKYTRTKKLSRMGVYNHTFNSIWNSLPLTLIKDVKSAHLALIIDLCYNSRTIGENEAYKELSAWPIDKSLKDVKNH